MSTTPGVRRRTGAGHVMSYGEGRVCAVKGCDTRLSRYNGKAECAEHDHDEHESAALDRPNRPAG